MPAIRQPRNTRSVRTRSAILDAAWQLLQARGPAATSMDAVALAAGVTRRGLYLHFPTRTDLLVALIEHIDAALDLEASTRPMREAPEALAALDAWAWHVTLYHSRIRVVLDAIDRTRDSDPAAAAVWAASMARWRSAAQDLAQRLEREGKLARGWRAPRAGEAVWSLMLGFNPMWRALVDDSGWSIDQFGSFFARLHRATFAVQE